jgi:hypothetical protein
MPPYTMREKCAWGTRNDRAAAHLAADGNCCLRLSNTAHTSRRKFLRGSSDGCIATLSAAVVLEQPFSADWQLICPGDPAASRLLMRFDDSHLHCSWLRRSTR